jgi:hypothetical protein
MFLDDPEFNNLLAAVRRERAADRRVARAEEQASQVLAHEARLAEQVRRKRAERLVQIARSVAQAAVERMLPTDFVAGEVRRFLRPSRYLLVGWRLGSHSETFEAGVAFKTVTWHTVLSIAGDLYLDVPDSPNPELVSSDDGFRLNPARASSDIVERLERMLADFVVTRLETLR